jgi:SPP1 gp7 family putative phage head morphogenesis protein
MPIQLHAIRFLEKHLDSEEAAFHLAAAKNTEALERKYLARIEKLFRSGSTDLEGLEEILGEHYFESALQALRSMLRGEPIHLVRANSKTSRTRVPKSLRQKELKERIARWTKEWRKWRKTHRLPGDLKKKAREIREEYLKSVRRVFRERGPEFEKADPEEIKRAIIEGTKMPAANAATMVRTNTTWYQNQVRRDFYDQVPDVTHYLFLAIRDAATTKWCETRHGLVYAKGDPLVDKEMPPIHWNCRSEMLPLDPDNPRHAKILEKENVRRRNNAPEPLPKAFKRI